jgi:hypothetical protein
MAGRRLGRGNAAGIRERGLVSHRVRALLAYMDDDWLPEKPATAAAYEMLPEWVRWSGEQADVPGPLIERSVAVAERRQLDAETPPGQTGPCVVIKASRHQAYYA